MSRILEQANKRTKYAWAMFYQSNRENHNTTINRVEYIDTLPEFVKSEIKSLYDELKKDVTCPICLDVIDIGVLEFSRCGHKYCENCLFKLKECVEPKCAICRKTL
tara:strand:+ start:7361 stop:7678 length:318 start_codon:yes stop_codon:yes gene_type:complete